MGVETALDKAAMVVWAEEAAVKNWMEEVVDLEVKNAVAKRKEGGELPSEESEAVEKAAWEAKETEGKKEEEDAAGDKEDKEMWKGKKEIEGNEEVEGITDKWEEELEEMGKMDRDREVMWNGEEEERRGVGREGRGHREEEVGMWGGEGEEAGAGRSRGLERGVGCYFEEVEGGRRGGDVGREDGSWGGGGEEEEMGHGEGWRCRVGRWHGAGGGAGQGQEGMGHKGGGAERMEHREGVEMREREVGGVGHVAEGGVAMRQLHWRSTGLDPRGSWHKPLDMSSVAGADAPRKSFVEP
ncbi:hypothetical protein CYMTET_41899 [Cymbomonas tetramitiformis]|uniref:Uncharacterized protein n=1 Tax=Cymbomonas tetramitiformis TaxID=36881 RepID=A0AAE0C6I1_9CHLO|nr:hypothetical protein CYMTET_41899 [Cymbomonas tetramitiformis]